MKREEFIEELKEKNYYYVIEEDKLVVIGHDIYLGSIKTIPSDVKFSNTGSVSLNELKTVPSGVEFNNGGDVYLQNLETITPVVKFNNEGYIYFESLKMIPPGVEFNNNRNISMEPLIREVYIRRWKGNIDGINHNALLNMMIKRGMYI